jgi:hypothetical protein
MIVTMQGQNAIPANSTNPNILSGQRYERSPFTAGVGNLYCTGSAAGLTAELNIGGNSVTPPTVVNTQNRLPVVPDDILSTGWEVLEGRLLQVTVVNTTGGALTYFWRVDIEEAELEISG